MSCLSRVDGTVIFYVEHSFRFGMSFWKFNITKTFFSFLENGSFVDESDQKTFYFLKFLENLDELDVVQFRRHFAKATAIFCCNWGPM